MLRLLNSKLKLAFIIILISGLASCEKPPTLKAELLNQKNIISLNHCTMDAEDPFSCIQNNCEQTGGVFSVNQKQCMCAPGEVFIGHSQRGCEPIVWETLKARGQVYLFLKSAVFKENAFGEPRESSDVVDYADLESLQFTIHYPAQLENSVDTLSLEEIPRLSLPLVMPYRFSEVKFMPFESFGKEDVLNLLKDREFPLYETLANPKQNYSFNYIYYPWEKKSLRKFFAVNNHISDRHKISNTPLPRRVLHLLEIQDSNFTFKGSQGCLDGCTEVREVSFDNRHFRWERIFAYGHLMENRLRVIDPASTYQKIYYFDSYNRLRFTLEVQLASKNNQLLYQVKLIPLQRPGTRGSFLKPKNFSFTLIENQLHEEKLFSYMNGEKSRPTVVLCDTELLPSMANNSEYTDLFHYLLKGTSEVGPYGWMSESTSWEDSFSGLLNGSSLNFPQYYKSNHALKVAQHLRGVQIIPISMNQCFEKFDNWSYEVGKQASVINLSFAFYQEAQFCAREKNWNEILASTEDTYLWVTGAGNDGKNLDLYAPEELPLCPQGLMTNKPNTLVVGHLPQNRNQASSNYGARSVHLFTKAASTSEASAMVSKLAAELSEKYLLTPRQVRSVLRLSAHFGRGGKSEVNEKDAFKAAAFLMKYPWSNTFDVLEKLHCEKSEVSPHNRPVFYDCREELMERKWKHAKSHNYLL